MNLSFLATVNAFLNLTSAVFLVVGFAAIKRGDDRTHKRWMISALVSSGLFLVSYCIYHYAVGSVPYQHYDWTRPLYFAILIPHVILAGAQVPFIIAAVWFAYRGRFDRHKMITRRLWYVWMFVSVSGVAVYLMLYHL